MLMVDRVIATANTGSSSGFVQTAHCPAARPRIIDSMNMKLRFLNSLLLMIIIILCLSDCSGTILAGQMVIIFFHSSLG